MGHFTVNWDGMANPVINALGAETTNNKALDKSQDRQAERSSRPVISTRQNLHSSLKSEMK